MLILHEHSGPYSVSDLYIMCVMFVQRFEPQGRHFTNFLCYYYYLKIEQMNETHRQKIFAFFLHFQASLCLYFCSPRYSTTISII